MSHAQTWDVAVNGDGALRPVGLHPMTWTEANRAAKRLNRIAREYFAHVVPYGALAAHRVTGHWRAA